MRFLFYNVSGGILWVTMFLFGGYFFGNIPAVKAHFSLVIFAIVLVSFAPIIFKTSKNLFSKLP
jgi:membrane-associated protein